MKWVKYLLATILVLWTVGCARASSTSGGPSDEEVVEFDDAIQDGASGSISYGGPGAQ